MASEEESTESTGELLPPPPPPPVFIAPDADVRLWDDESLSDTEEIPDEPLPHDLPQNSPQRRIFQFAKNLWFPPRPKRNQRKK